MATGGNFTALPSLYKKWVDVACSTSGEYAIAGYEGVSPLTSYDGAVYVSTNGGVTWTLKVSDIFPSVVSTSANGQYQTFTAVAKTTYQGRIYYSTDYGDTWNYYVPEANAIQSGRIIILPGGQTQFMVSNWGSGFVLKTTDCWATASKVGPGTAQSIQDFYSSDDEAYYLKIVANALYMSTDQGANWSAVSGPTGTFYTCMMSSTGQYMMATVNNNLPWRSANYGSTWTAVGSSRAAASGQKQTHIIPSGKMVYYFRGGYELQVSNDYGATFTAYTYYSPQQPNGVAICGGGSNYRIVYFAGASLMTEHYLMYVSDYEQIWSEDAVSASGAPTRNEFYSPVISGTNNAATSDSLTKIPAEPLLTETATSGEEYLVLKNNAVQHDAQVGKNWFPIMGGNSAYSGTAANNQMWGTTCTLHFSKTGQYQVLCRSTNYLATSSDYGATWTERNASRNWVCAGVSASGQYMTAAVSSGYLYNSTDSGANWTERTGPGARAWVRVSVSATTGQYQAAVHGQGYIYTSSDYGATWTSRLTDSSTRQWTDVSVSADGSVMVAAQSNAAHTAMYASTDYGATWSPVASLPFTRSFTMSMSSTGSTVGVVTHDGTTYKIYVSTDSRATWTEMSFLGTIGTPTAIFVSSGGTRLLARVYYTSPSANHAIYASYDSGTTWHYVSHATTTVYLSSANPAYQILPTTFSPIAYEFTASADLNWMAYSGSYSSVRTPVLSGEDTAVTMEGVASSDVAWNSPFLIELTESSSAIQTIYQVSATNPYEESFVESGHLNAGAKVSFEKSIAVPSDESATASDLAWQLMHTVDEGAVANEGPPAVWFGTQLVSEEAISGDEIEFELTLFYKKMLKHDLQFVRVDQSQRCTFSLVAPVFFVNNFYKSFLHLEYDLFAQVFAANESLRFSLNEAPYPPIFTSQRLIFSQLPHRKTTMFKIEYRVLLDDIDVTHLISSMTINYALDSFAADVDVTWAHTSLIQKDGDNSLYTMLECSNIATNYEKERLYVYTRVATDENPTWLLQGSFFLEKRGTTVDYRSVVPTSWGRNRPALLALPHAEPLTKTWEENTTAVGIASELCANAGVDLSWEVADYRVLGSNIVADGEEPISIISTLAATVGGILTSDKDGTLRVVYRYAIE